MGDVAEDVAGAAASVSPAEPPPPTAAHHGAATCPSGTAPSPPVDQLLSPAATLAAKHTLIREQLQAARKEFTPIVTSVLQFKKQLDPSPDAVAKELAEKKMLTALLTDINALQDYVRRAVPYAGTGSTSSNRIEIPDEAPAEHIFPDLWVSSVETTFEQAVRASLSEPIAGWDFCTVPGTHHKKEVVNRDKFARKKLRCKPKDSDFSPQSPEWAIERVRGHPRGALRPHTVLYTMHTPFCYEANKALRNLGLTGADPASDPAFRRWESYSYMLLRELLRSPAFEGLTFRASGFRADRHQTRPGAIIVLFAMTSSAAVPNAIKPFLGDRGGLPYGTIMVMHTLRGRDISSESECPWEAEVLLLPGLVYRVAAESLGKGLRTLLGHALLIELGAVDVVEAKETRLLFWADAVDAFTDAELLRNEDVVTLISKLENTYRTGQQQAFDPVTRGILDHMSGPMARLPKARQGDGQTLLHIAAAKQRNASALRVLLHALRAKDVNVLNHEGQNCLAVAAGLPDNTEAIAHILVKGGVVSRLTQPQAEVAVSAAVECLTLNAVKEAASAARLAGGGSDKGGRRLFHSAVRAAVKKAKNEKAMPLLNELVDAAGGWKSLGVEGIFAAAAAARGCEGSFISALAEKVVLSELPVKQADDAAVFRAVAAGNAHIIAALSTAGCNVDAVPSGGDSGGPLHEAAWRGDCDSVEALRAAGADCRLAYDMTMDGERWKGITPLHAAAFHGQHELLRPLAEGGGLIDAGATLIAAEEGGLTPLCVAALKGHAGCVTQLLAAGAGANARSSRGATPAYYAAQSGYTEVLKLLAVHPGADLDLRQEDGRTALWAASWCGQHDAVAFLVKHGVGLNPKYGGGSALWWAKKEGHTKTVQILLDAGAK